MEISLVSKLVIIRWQILFLSRKKGMLKSLVPTQTMQEWEFNWTNKVFCNVWMCHEFGSSKAFSKQKFHIHTSYNASCCHDLITRGKYSGGAKKAWLAWLSHETVGCTKKFEMNGFDILLCTSRALHYLCFEFSLVRLCVEMSKGSIFFPSF